MAASTIDFETERPHAESNPLPDALSGGLSLTIDIRRAVRVILVVIATLIVTGTAANIITNQVAPSKEHKLAKLMNRFDLAFEPSVPNWYSSCSLLACAILLAVIARAKARSSDRWFWHWLVLAALFVCLSIDEGVRFHEMMHTVIASRVETHGLLYFPWVIPALIFAAVVGLYYLPFLIRLDRHTAVLFAVAGATYVMGAVGMDMIGGIIVEAYGMESIHHSFAQTVEELLEMVGVLVFLYALMDHIRRHVGRVQLCFAST
jgi:hypothetical protein